MATINQIKSKLLELEAGVFQCLCDDWLFRKGYKNINAIGMTKISNKTKTGTPDTLICQEDGTYIFSEYTTQQGNLKTKIGDDIDKCLDPDKTGIETNKITKITVCHLGDLTTKDINELTEKCSTHNINLLIFNIDAIALSLKNDYPQLAYQHLSISVDTGQVLEITDFIVRYNSNEFSTPIDNEILFQDEKLREGQELLESTKCLVITGSAGVGKTLYAINLLKQIKNNFSQLKIFCIFNMDNPDLSKDLTSYVSESGDYLIFIDDANRLDARLDYVLHYINETVNYRSFKIIMTVRGYAKDIVINKLEQIATYQEITISQLNQDQTTELLNKQFNIKNHNYQQRIWDISKGNPRIIVMAANVLNKTNQLSTLQNVSSLYDQYFGKNENVRDVNDNPNLMKTLCIISLFRVIDKQDEAKVNVIQNVLGLDITEFWEHVNTLHQKELVDLYENEIVKIVDQILSTYLFYQAVFIKKVMPFESLLDGFHSKESSILLKDMLLSVLNSFNGQKIIEEIKPNIQAIYTRMIKEGQTKEIILDFLNSYWFIIPNTALLYSKNLISQISPEQINWENITFEASTQTRATNTVLSLLKNFRGYCEEEFVIAFDLILELASKNIQYLPQIIYTFTNQFNFRSYDFKWCNFVQKITINKLFEASQLGANYLYSRLFICVSEDFLKTEHLDDGLSEGMKIYTTQFQLPVNEDILVIRKKIFDGLTLLLPKPEHRFWILKVLQNYIYRAELESKEIIEADLPFIKELINIFDLNNIDDSLLLIDYCDALDNMGISYPEIWRTHTANKTTDIIEILSIEIRHEIKSLELSYSEYKDYCKNRLKNYLNKLSIFEINSFFGVCEKLLNSPLASISSRDISSGIRSAISILAETHIENQEQLLNYYTNYRKLTTIMPYELIHHLVKIKESAESYKIINSLDIENKKLWLTYYFEQLPQEKITLDTVKLLIKHFEQMTVSRDLPQRIGFLENYQHIESDIFIIITKILLTKANQDPLFVSPIIDLLKLEGQIFEKWLELNQDDKDLIYKSYLLLIKITNSFDYNGKILEFFLQHNFNFLIEFIDTIYERDISPSKYAKMPSLDFLWSKESYIHDIEVYGMYVYNKNMHFSDSIFHKLFYFEMNDKTFEILEKQKQFLKQTIENHIDNIGYIVFIFSIVNFMSYEIRLEILRHFLLLNNKFADFQQIGFTPNSKSWSGSLVPILEEEKRYLLQVLALLNTSDLLEHREYIENYISHKNVEISQEKKRDYLRDF